MLYYLIFQIFLHTHAHTHAHIQTQYAILSMLLSNTNKFESFGCLYFISSPPAALEGSSGGLWSVLNLQRMSRIRGPPLWLVCPAQHVSAHKHTHGWQNLCNLQSHRKLMIIEPPRCTVETAWKIPKMKRTPCQ